MCLVISSIRPGASLFAVDKKAAIFLSHRATPFFISTSNSEQTLRLHPQPVQLTLGEAQSNNDKNTSIEISPTFKRLIPVRRSPSRASTSAFACLEGSVALFPSSFALSSSKQMVGGINAHGIISWDLNPPGEYIVPDLEYQYDPWLTVSKVIAD